LLVQICLAAALFCWALPAVEDDKAAREQTMRHALDAPIVFVKQFNYLGLHIYDTYYKWRPGGGIYLLENPSDPPEKQRVKPIIDPTTPGTLGAGVYSHPDLSFDAKRLLFCFKGSQTGSTSIYEINVDGTGLRRVSDPNATCECYKGSHGGQHDVAPAYLPDGRIVFTSTRPSGLVPCANSGVNILHVMNADGSNLHPISVNNVNEFDPSVMPDGRIIYGRWEYVDKTALTQQSVWTIFPDGTNETAVFANNMVFPEAVLDVRAVPGSEHLICGTFAPHNAPPRGTIAFIDPLMGKNSPNAITNLEYPDKPTFDRGESCEPWPLSEELVLYSGRAPLPSGAPKPKEGGPPYNALMLIDRNCNKVVIHAEPDMDCHNPMLVIPRPTPPVISSITDGKAVTGRLLVQDVYEGLDNVKRGEIKWLRVLEETSRVSATPGGNQPYNQTFLISCALAFSVKSFLGIAPVEADGSAYFEVPSGRAIYLQALDGDMRLVRSMRTFISAAPGVTRSCVGCHEFKYGAPPRKTHPKALEREPNKLKDESWGSGFVDYPDMVQPVLDKHCVSCHGGDKGFQGKLDLSGGWTQHFNISYENLTSRRFTQLTAYLISGIDCMNGTAHWSAQIMPPKSHGSSTAPLAEILLSGHKGYIPNLGRAERDLLLAWIDSNGLYHGTWDYTKNGCSIDSWEKTKNAIVAEMAASGCMKCHGNEKNQPTFFEDDWFNLERPELSRVLRAPLAVGRASVPAKEVAPASVPAGSSVDITTAGRDAGATGLGEALCRDAKLLPGHQRVRMLWHGYAHAVQPVEYYKEPAPPAPIDPKAPVVTTFASTQDPHYQKLLEIIRKGKRDALATPRVDMPGADVQAGVCRQFHPPPMPDPMLELKATVDADCIVRLSWERSARTIGLAFEVHHGDKADFAPDAKTLMTTTRLFRHADMTAQTGPQHYALMLLSGDNRSAPIRASVTVPPPPPPKAPEGLLAKPAAGRIELEWKADEKSTLRYHVYRASIAPASLPAETKQLTTEPITATSYCDASAADGAKYSYTVKSVSRRGAESAPSAAVSATALPEVKDPVLLAPFAQDLSGKLQDGSAASGKAQGKAKILPAGTEAGATGVLDLREGGYVTFDHRSAYELDRRLTVECWVNFTDPGQMPVIVSCGDWGASGWLLQRIGGGWRWHLAGIDCDGGKSTVGQWTHLVGTFDGQTARVYENGKQVAEKSGAPKLAPFTGALHVGHYSARPSDAPYQVTGMIAGLKIYNRILSQQEIEAAAADNARFKQK
jgi:hypothetical protein